MAEAYVDATFDLTPDAVVVGLRGGDHRLTELLTLCGFLGDSDIAGHHRVFTDPSLNCWVDVADEDIRYRTRISAEHDAFGGRSVVWVDKNAVLVKGEITTADAEADFLSGRYSDALPYLPSDGLECATQSQKSAYAYAASPKASPNPGCCAH